MLFKPTIPEIEKTNTLKAKFLIIKQWSTAYTTDHTFHTFPQWTLKGYLQFVLLMCPPEAQCLLMTSGHCVYQG